MKLLVTGGAGYIGGVVTHALVEAGHRVVVLDDLSTGFADTVPAGVEFHRLPVHQVGAVLTPDSGFDGVLHFAAKIEVAESVARPDLYWDVNVGGTMARAQRGPRGRRAADALLLHGVDVRPDERRAAAGRRVQQADRGRRHPAQEPVRGHQARG